MSSRYAIYYSPEAQSPLSAFGNAWLGRDTESGLDVPRLRAEALAPEAVASATALPARYGFHATLKPPFRLRPPYTETDLRKSMASFAASQPPVATPPLELTVIGSFIALAPARPAEELDDLARNCVVFFDLYRRPPDRDELKRRRAVGLSPRQNELLERFGYPFVLDEFRFHMTLTGKVADQELRRSLFATLRRLVEPFSGRAVTVREICLFRQEGPERRFTCVQRMPLTGR